MTDSVLLVSRPQEGCVCLTLNRPERRNALSTPLRQALVRKLDELAGDDSVRVLILTGAGAGFCAGLDLKELSEQGLSGRQLDKDPATALTEFPRPVIGAINGVAITGGLELALACDVLLASTEARFADTHGRVGVMPGWGMSQKLPRLIGMGRAKEMSFSGNFIDAATAERWGLVNRVLPPDELMPTALALAADMADALPEMLHNYKRLMDQGYGMPLAEALALEKQQSKAWAATQTPEALAQRTAGVQARGRQQQG